MAFKSIGRQFETDNFKNKPVINIIQVVKVINYRDTNIFSPKHQYFVSEEHQRIVFLFRHRKLDQTVNQ